MIFGFHSMQILSLVISVLVHTTIATVTPSAFQYDYKKLTLSMLPSFTCAGTWEHPLATDDTKRQYSRWAQDTNKMVMRLDIGVPGETGFTILIAGDHEQSYSITNSESNKNIVTCAKIPLTFTETISAYLYPYVRYMYQGTFNGKLYDIYAGNSPDPFAASVISNLIYVDPVKNTFGFLSILTTDGFFYYNYDTQELGAPDPAIFDVSQYCGSLG